MPCILKTDAKRIPRRDCLESHSPWVALQKSRYLVARSRPFAFALATPPCRPLPFSAGFFVLSRGWISENETQLKYCSTEHRISWHLDAVSRFHNSYRRRAPDKLMSIDFATRDFFGELASGFPVDLLLRSFASVVPSSVWNEPHDITPATLRCQQTAHTLTVV